MTREEEVLKKAKEEAWYIADTSQTKEEAAVSGYCSGAKYADKTMIDKACEWLKINIEDYDAYDAWRGNYTDIEALINDFRQAMKE